MKREMNKIPPMRRLPLAGAGNTRDLGGYPCAGGVTRWGRFLRSDCPNCLTQEDISFLAAYGVDTAIDLRREDETQSNPSRLLAAPGFTTHTVSLNDSLMDIDFEGDIPNSMSGLYIHLLDNCAEQLVQVMDLLADAEGGALFHCAVGKDRTGVVAMLLLGLAGVEEADIIADYAITDIYMDEIYDAQAGVFRGGALPDYVLRSRPASMQRVLRHLREHYGTAEAYLLKAGLKVAKVKKLWQKLVETV